MKQLTGINRVTLKKRDGLIFVINDPEVLKSTSNDNSYAVFGELKLEDPNNKFGQNQAQIFNEKEGEAKTAPATDKKEESKPEDDGAPLNEEGLTANHIDMVMQHASCTRNEAIKALREANDDMVQAVMLLTK